MAEAFKIGLTMAGAISAGAYTAGVLDFLIQALEEWEKAKAGLSTPDERGPVPWHDVEVAVLTGASAGSICSALFAASIGRPFVPSDRSDEPEPDQNKLYDVWVKKANIEGLLGSTDLKGSTINSLLDSEYLTQMARSVLALSGSYRRPKYIADPLEILLTTGNLRGVAYEVPFSGGPVRGHDMVVHGDWQHFYVSTAVDDDLKKRDVVWLDPTRSGSEWTIDLCDAALGSSAFPIGLSARLLRRSPAYYGRRLWAVPEGEASGPDPKPQSFAYAVWYSERPIPPLSPDSKATGTYDYVAVDGGTYNNEPFDLARRVLSGDSYRNKRDGNTADRAVIMVDPFPDPFDKTAAYQSSLDLLSVAKRLLGGFTQQSRFKPEDLALAQKPDIFSRYLMAPIRTRGVSEPPGAPAMASASLSGFGGFLCEAFRAHDYQLGRRNCQRFLENHFALYWDNPVFGGQKGQMPRKDDPFNFPDDDPVALTGRQKLPPPQISFRPIIPLVGSAKPPVSVQPFPKMPLEEYEALRERIGKRLDETVRKARSIYAKPWFWHGASWLAWKALRHPTLDVVQSAIEKDLRHRGLLA